MNFTRAIVRPPAPNFSKGLTTAVLGAPVYPLALQQHHAYCQALEQCGLTLTWLEPDECYPDSCFIEDAALIVNASSSDQVTTADRKNHAWAIVTRPGAASRAGEVESIRRVLADIFPSLHDIQSPGTLDGGDVCQAGNHFFIGISERTNEEGARQLADLLAQIGYASSLIHIRLAGKALTVPLLHLKSGLSYLGDRRLVVSKPLVKLEAFGSYDLVKVDAAEDYSANCIRVNDYVVLAAGFPRFEASLQKLGYQTIALDMSEFQKMDGGLSCLSLRF